MSELAQRLAWRYDVKTPEQRLVLVTLGMLANEQLQVSFSCAALGRISRMASADVWRVVQELYERRHLIFEKSAGQIMTVRFALCGLGFDLSTRRPSVRPAEAERLIAFIGGPAAAARVFGVCPTTVYWWKGHGIPRGNLLRFV